MSRTVMCKKLNKELPALDFPPMPGKKGQEIYETISKQAWADWLQHQTRLINEKHLSLMDLSHREYLSKQLDLYLNNQTVDQADGYVPESD